MGTDTADPRGPLGTAQPLGLFSPGRDPARNFLHVAAEATVRTRPRGCEVWAEETPKRETPPLSPAPTRLISTELLRTLQSPAQMASPPGSPAQSRLC